MLLLKRLATAAVVFVLLFCLLFFTTLVVAGGIVASKAVKDNPDAQKKADIARKAGEEFGTKYGVPIGFGALVLASATALALSFSGILPWCRKPSSEQEPPPMPESSGAEPPLAAPVACKPHGFDPGLQCLAVTLAFWVVVRFLLPLAKTFASALVGTIVTFLAVTSLNVALVFVWVRTRKSANPPRTWAIAWAAAWAGLMLLSWLYIMFSELA